MPINTSGNSFIWMHNCLKNFLTLPDEKLLFARREHLFKVLLSLGLILLIMFISLVTSLMLLSFMFQLHFVDLVGISFIIVLITLSLVVKSIVDWYFHFYVITNRKILEVTYRPFFSKEYTTVSLDQVRCVETVIKTYGILKTILDIGDVVFQFDMLTHQKTFVLANISPAHTAGVYMGDTINSIIAERQQTQILPNSTQKYEEDNFINTAPAVEPKNDLLGVGKTIYSSLFSQVAPG